MQSENERDNQIEENIPVEIQNGKNQDLIQNDQNEESPEIMILSNGTQQYKINKKIIKFSQLLEFTYEDESHEANILNFDIPQQILIGYYNIKLIQKFMKTCQYDPHKVKLKKIEAYYWKADQQCMKEIKKFIQENLAQLDTQKLKQLISLCRYLQINSLVDVIYYHLADKYSVSYSMKIAQQQLDKYQVKKMNQKELNELKLQYFDYFNKLSTQYKDIQEDKQKIKQQMQNKKQNNIEAILQNYN